MARIENKQYFAKGSHGVVYTALINGTKVAIKEKNPNTTASPIKTEAQMLKLVNTKGLGPKFVKTTKRGVVYVFQPGIPFHKWMQTASTKQLKRALLNLLLQCYELDKLKINKMEMMRPYSNVIYYRKPVLIDFERAYKTSQPKNVTQFIQFLTTYSLLKQKGIALSRKKVIPFAKEYKKNSNKKTFNELFRFVSTSFSS